MNRTPSTLSSWQVLRYAAGVLALVGLALILTRIVYALLLAFAGMLVAVFIRAISGRIERWTGWPAGAAVAVT